MEWVAFYKLNPWGEERADTRNAMLCLIVCRALGNKHAKLSDFLIQSDCCRGNSDMNALRSALETLSSKMKRQRGRRRRR